MGAFIGDRKYIIEICNNLMRGMSICCSSRTDEVSTLLDSS
jgi:hypothetical protein